MTAPFQDLRIQTTYVSYPYDGSIAAAIAGSLVRAFRRWQARRAAARWEREAAALLLRMSDRDLRDIGLTRDALHRLHRDGLL